ncbi:TPA: preprotein translocase subunit SecG [Candidatus Dependentiae bacterium]|nr:MAG: Preprotein translocase, SecG subunit [candidate division TM6 bacterium GW2011_GWE2_31_21]KKP53254.1 MAG: Preprotein translocase, SecG subunit [candidate division TM6 bacterium GW2011_GWF2_33_332]HBS48047.1 preprotein translocase subunit SecG [Candidatus Dependentiae bacterium]HBZ73350.1 preprotein translocase subunit SecG [Candidatus Dependentiae bacterium]
MMTFLMILFIIVCFFLAIFIFIQKGKGDLGLGSLGGNQMLFGGSGGQDFFEKITWTLGSIFILGALGLALLKTHTREKSIISDYSIPMQKTIPAIPETKEMPKQMQQNPTDIPAETTETKKS